VDLLFYCLESLGLELFEFVLGFAHVSGLYLLVDLFGGGGWGHLSTTYFTVRVAYRVEHSACAALPLHH
jgi:hypothetical protein